MQNDLILSTDKSLATKKKKKEKSSNLRILATMLRIPENPWDNASYELLCGLAKMDPFIFHLILGFLYFTDSPEQ